MAWKCAGLPLAKCVLNDVLVRAMRVTTQVLRSGYCPDLISCGASGCQMHHASGSHDSDWCSPTLILSVPAPKGHPWHERMRKVYTLVRQHAPSSQAEPTAPPAATFEEDSTNHMITCTVAAWQAQEA
jgi:hypothetical protein